MGLIGLLFGLILNIFFASDALTWLLTFLGIGIFIVLIAYDTQKLKKYAQMAEANGAISSYAIRGALALYLDFVNLFIRLMAIFGRRK
jgi:FtsH-binding integral membrane protein